MPLISLEVLDREDTRFQSLGQIGTPIATAFAPPPLSDSFRAVSSKRRLSAPWALNTIRDARMKCRYLKPSSAPRLSVMWLNKKNAGQHTQRPNDCMVAMYPGFVSPSWSRMVTVGCLHEIHDAPVIHFTVAASALTSQSCNIQICPSGNGRDMKCTDVDLRTRCTQRNQATYEVVYIKEKKKMYRGINRDISR